MTKRRGHRVLLAQISVDVAQGCVLGLAGDNGAGKSTLLAILAGWMRPTAGTVRVLGHEPASTALIGKIAALPEGAPFPPGARVGRYLSYIARLQGVTAPESIV
ncbi:MAG: ATP-binding cassette domain-containing protein, partial [Polyangiaceae bacterium]